MKHAVKLVLKPRLTSESKKQRHEKWCADINTTIKSVLGEVLSEVRCSDSVVTNWKHVSLCSDFVSTDVLQTIIHTGRIDDEYVNLFSVKYMLEPRKQKKKYYFLKLTNYFSTL